MTSRRIGLLLGTGAVFAALSILPLFLVDAREGQVDRMAELDPAPAFTMIDSNGKPFSTSSLQGKVWVVDFIFTSCPGICPGMATQMARLHRLFADYPNVSFVSISVDPERDTEQVLAEYAAKLKADTTRWHFLRGDMKVVQDLSLNGFKLSQLTVPSEHSPRFVLVDQNGTIRGYYDSRSDAEIRKLSDDVAELISK
jgi:protein SCO1/2